MGVEDAEANATQETGSAAGPDAGGNQPSPSIWDPVARELAPKSMPPSPRKKRRQRRQGEQQQDVAAASPRQPAALAKHADAKGNLTAAIIALRRRSPELQQKLMLATRARPGADGRGYGKGGEPVASRAGSEQQPAAEPDTIERCARAHGTRRTVRRQMTGQDMEAQRQKLDDREWGIRQAMLAPAPVCKRSAPQAGNSKLETDYPCAQILSAQDLRAACRPGTDTGRPRVVLRQSSQVPSVARPENACQTLAISISAAALLQPPLPPNRRDSARTPWRGLQSSSWRRVCRRTQQIWARPRLTSPCPNQILSRMEGMSEEEQWALMKTLPGSVAPRSGDSDSSTNIPGRLDGRYPEMATPTSAAGALRVKHWSLTVTMQGRTKCSGSAMVS